MSPHFEFALSVVCLSVSLPCCRGKRQRVFLSSCIIGVWDQRSRWVGEKWIEANWRRCQWVSKQSPCNRKKTSHLSLSLTPSWSFVTGINSTSNNVYATSKKKQPNCCQWGWKQGFKVGGADWKRVEKDCGCSPAHGRDFCGQSRRRDPGVLLPDMFEFSFSWPRKRFPLWDVNSCGVAQFNLSGVTEWHGNYIKLTVLVLQRCQRMTVDVCNLVYVWVLTVLRAWNEYSVLLL